jgi:drug/metabolite transporter (DMT)-like permease
VDQYLALGATESSGRYTLGIASAVMALGCWTWYGVANSAYLKAGQHITATAWTIAQGVSLIPLVGIGIIVLAAFDVEPRAPGSDAGRWTTFAVVSLIVGIGSTWLATLCWSRASRLLPTTLAGQFIVCTPVAAMIYGSLYRQSLPSPAVTLGVLLLTGAVLLAIRAIQRPSPATP